MAGTSPTSATSSTLPIYKLINNTTTPVAASSSNSQDSAITSQLGPAAFLNLLTTQLSNQDPLNPMDDTQSVSQLAQFSALQASQNLETSFANFQSNFGVLQASTLIGKTVTVNASDAAGNSSSLTGTVAAISVIKGQPQLTLTGANGKVITDANGNPVTFTTSQITGIQ